jgi:hypothetical protein
MAQRAGEHAGLELILPSETRWLDYFRALERALTLKSALQAMREDDMLRCDGVTGDFLHEDFWTRVSAFVAVLKKFYITSRNAQSQSMPTLSACRVGSSTCAPRVCERRRTARSRRSSRARC